MIIMIIMIGNDAENLALITKNKLHFNLNRKQLF